jgi:hypothetical protein
LAICKVSPGSAVSTSRAGLVRSAPFAGASGAANAVNEILRLGQVVVDDVRDILHVNAARSDVGRHQDAVASLLESGQGCVRCDCERPP